MPEEGHYILSNVSFSCDEHPVLSLQNDQSFVDMDPLDRALSIRFDLSKRFCVGWRDISTHERFVCPDSATLNDKYSECTACQKRTGFNPAFYNASSVSEQQDVRNREPHILYLAYFGKNLIKVGISHAKRGRARLLEQGARSAIILDTFPTALIARQYEAKIADLDGIVETVQIRKKIDMLKNDYDNNSAEKVLQQTKIDIEKKINVNFNNSKLFHLDSVFFPNGTPDLNDSFDCTHYDKITGQAIGMLGSILFCKYKNEIVFLPMKKYVGYILNLSFDETDISLPAKQATLF